jgi:hypothetical protein
MIAPRSSITPTPKLCGDLSVGLDSGEGEKGRERPSL